MKLKLFLHRINLWDLFVRLFLVAMAIDGIRVIPNSIGGILKYTYVAVGLVAIFRKRNGCIKVNSVKKWLIVFLLVSLLCLILSPYLSLSMVMAYLQLAIINFYLIAVPQVYIRKFAGSYMGLFKIMIELAIIYSLFLAVFGTDVYLGELRYNCFGSILFSQRKLGTPDSYGYSSFFGNPNPFGFYIVVVLAWHLVHFNKSKPKDYASLLLFAVGLSLANSRAAYLCTALVIAAVLYLKLNNRLVRAGMILLPCSALGIFVLSHLSKMLDFVTNIDLNGRGEVWSHLIDSIKLHPLLGTGYSSSTKVILSDIAQSTYNSYLTILTEEGIVGLIVFAAFILCVFYSIIMAFKRDQTNPLAKFCAILTLVMLLEGMLENAFMNITARSLLWEFFLFGVSGTGANPNFAVTEATNTDGTTQA